MKKIICCALLLLLFSAPCPGSEDQKPPAPVQKEATVLPAEPAFARLDFRNVPVADRDREAALRDYEKLVDAVKRKDRGAILAGARAMSRYGLDDIAQAACAAFADTCADRTELIAAAAEEAKREEPHAQALFARAVYDAAQKGDTAGVGDIAQSIAAIPAAKDAWIDAVRYLLDEAGGRGNIVDMAAFSKQLYLGGDPDGAQMGFERCCAMAPGPKERLQLEKDFSAFGYERYADAELAQFFEDALSVGDDRAALGFLERIRKAGSERAEVLILQYLRSAAARGMPLEDPLRASSWLAAYDSADTNVALLEVWREIGRKAVSQRQSARAEQAADFMASLKGKVSASSATELYARVLRLEPKAPLERKMMILEKAARLGQSSLRFLREESPPAMKQAAAQKNSVAVDTLCGIMLGSKDPALAGAAREGVRQRLQWMRNEPLAAQCDAAAPVIASTDPGLRAMGVEMAREIAGRAKGAAKPEEALLVAERFVRLPVPVVRGEACALLKQLWLGRGKGRTYPAAFMERLIAAMSGSGDPFLEKAAAEARK